MTCSLTPAFSLAMIGLFSSIDMLLDSLESCLLKTGFLPLFFKWEFKALLLFSVEISEPHSSDCW